jgi:hypothetical protein
MLSFFCAYVYISKLITFQQIDACLWEVRAAKGYASLFLPSIPYRQ